MPISNRVEEPSRRRGEASHLYQKLLVFATQQNLLKTLQALLSPDYFIIPASSWVEFNQEINLHHPHGGIISIPRQPEIAKQWFLSLRSIPIPLILLLEKGALYPPIPRKTKDPSRIVVSLPFTPATLFSRTHNLMDCEQNSQQNPVGQPKTATVTFHPPRHQVDPLVVGITHRLNTFLVAIKTLCQLLRDKDIVGEQREFNQSVEKEIEQVERLLEDLTTFIGLVPSQLKEMSISALIEELFQEKRNGCTGVVRFNAIEPLPKVWSDPYLLGYAFRMLFNFLYESGATNIDIEVNISRGPSHPSCLLLNFCGDFPYPPSESMKRVLGMYLFLAKESLYRLRLELTQKDTADGKHSIQIQFPISLHSTKPSLMERKVKERRDTVIFEDPL